MRRKIIDDYLNDLFKIKLIFYHPSCILRLSESYICAVHRHFFFLKEKRPSLYLFVEG